MTSANGGTYEENIYATVRSTTWTLHYILILYILCFLLQGDNMKKTINYSRNQNVLKRKIIYLRCE